ncbi:H(+)/Cl(-) exchange transporter ClcA [Legionella sp. CNM-4043-24]|uniref:H(+)/Cl(-) exchange transporter ClcA n=1 Tax=Legionella sp. CNM-4043-24 TaxID=3421646 RepID=UPI00403A9BE1
MRERLLLIYGLSIVLGLLTGLAGSCFQLVIAWVNKGISQLVQLAALHHVGALVATALSMSMVLLAWLMVRYLAPEAAGSGVQEIEGVLLHKRTLYWRRLLPVKFFGGVLALSAKMVAGREGPTIQMGANLGGMLAEFFPLKRRRRDTLIAAGAAAGLATAFNAPLAGVLFVIEEMRNEFNFSFTNFKMVAICCVMATITTYLLIGSAPAIPLAVFNEPGVESLWFFFLFGLVVGAAGLLFNQTLVFWLQITDRFSLRERVLYVLAIGALVGILAYYNPYLVGGGYEIIEKFLALPPALTELSAVLLFRFVVTMLCYATGVPGGIFAPMLALGTLLGMVCFYFVNDVAPWLGIEPTMFAVAGMGALFSAAIRSPLTGIVLVVEMTRNYNLILPLMVSCLTATMVTQMAKNQPIYTQLLRRTLVLARKK